MTSTVFPSNLIIVLGLGQTGLSCVRFLLKRGCDIAIMDTREQPPSLAEMHADYPDIQVKTGGLDRDLIQQAGMIVLSPGIDPRLPEIVEAQQAGIEIVGDIELFARYANAPIIAITGSNGKSTVTTLLAEMAIAAGKTVQVGGNLGTAALDLIIEPAPDFYIVELSSFQLETVSSLNALASTVLNITADHLDRYDNEQAYHNAKARIFSGDGVMVINHDDELVKQLAKHSRQQIGFSLNKDNGAELSVMDYDGDLWLSHHGKPLLAVTSLKVVGKHNIANALAALALGTAMTLAMTEMLSALQQYQGLAHRCRLVLDYDGIRWFNDSKATNVGACIAAIEALVDSGKVILIAGGVGKAQDFSALTPVVERDVRAVIVLGKAASLIAKVIPNTIPTYHVELLTDAVLKAQSISHAGDNVLLSPACASFDMFSDYQARGNAFEQAVQELLND